MPKFSGPTLWTRGCMTQWGLWMVRTNRRERLGERLAVMMTVPQRYSPRSVIRTAGVRVLFSQDRRPRERFGEIHLLGHADPSSQQRANLFKCRPGRQHRFRNLLSSTLVRQVQRPGSMFGDFPHVQPGDRLVIDGLLPPKRPGFRKQDRGQGERNAPPEKQSIDRQDTGPSDACEAHHQHDPVQEAQVFWRRASNYGCGEEGAEACQEQDV